VVFDMEGKDVKNRKYRPNTFTGHARGLEGAGHEIDRHGPIIEALRDCKAVISHGMGRRIYNDLKQAGFEVLVTDQIDVENALSLYLNAQLIDRPDLGCNHQRECE
jgi:predicted Fe-Mo cluster-binding NifX family protein